MASSETVRPASLIHEPTSSLALCIAGEQKVRVKRPDSSLIWAKASIRSITDFANSLFVMLFLKFTIKTA